MLTEIECFVNWVRRRNPDARTWRDYRGDLRQFADLVGDLLPAAVTLRDIDRFVRQQASQGCQPSTINRRLAAITAFYTFLADEDTTLVCPVSVSYTHLRAHETVLDLVCRLLLEKKNQNTSNTI